MSNCEYCELWWAEGYLPQLTFYKPFRVESVVVGLDGTKGDGDAWDALQRIFAELGLNGWQLVSAAHRGKGFFFQRHLQ